MKKTAETAKKILRMTIKGIIILPAVLFLAFLLFPVVSNSIWKIRSGYKSIQEKPYECGRFGDKVMRIDRRYLAFSRVTYEGVDYWSKGFTKAHASKSCDDQIESASFEIKWPQMTPIPSKNWKDVDFVWFALNQRSLWPVERQGESKDFFDSTKLLLGYLSHTDTFTRNKEISLDEVNSAKTFNSELGLYEMKSYENERSMRVAFWQEVEGKGISPTIDCLYFKNDRSKCSYNAHIQDYGYHTSYLKIHFHADLLPHWKELHRDAMQLIEHFTVNGESQ